MLCAYAKAFDSGIFGRYPANKKKERGRRRKNKIKKRQKRGRCDEQKRKEGEKMIRLM